MSKTSVLIVNLGTPDNPTTPAVRSYLSQFLNDPRVIDLPYLMRKLLVNLIIVPFRAPKSAKVYQKLWTDEGSPILIHGINLQDKLQEALGSNFEVELAMRYKNPSIRQVLKKIQHSNPKKIIVVPLFPQYASATSGSVIQEVMETVKNWWVIPEMTFISQFWDDENYIDSFVERGREYELEKYDHVLFSYHGLPERQVDKVYPSGLCTDRDCENEVNDENQFCYKATCYGTSRLLAEKLNIPPDRYTVCFQSRLDKNWLRPFSDEVVVKLAKSGAKNILVFSPAFVADCLETTIEIGEEYQELFEQHGGERVQLVESLNDHPRWVEALKTLVLKHA